jgi:hypothetical protein
VVKLRVTATGDGGFASATSDGTQVVVPLAPVSAAAPLVRGLPRQGETLTAANGTWEPAPASYSYQWQRCDTAGANCVDISGATAQQYTATGGDAGHTLRSVVTAVNAGGSTPVTSAASAVIAAPSTPVLGPVEALVDPGCRYTSASVDAAQDRELDGNSLRGFAVFSGPDCEDNGDLVYFDQPADGSGGDPVLITTAYRGRVLGVATGADSGTYLLYVTQSGEIRSTQRDRDGVLTPGRVLAKVAPANARKVTGAVATARGAWWAVWSEPSGTGSALYEARTLDRVVNRRPVADAGVSAQPSLGLRLDGQATMAWIGPDKRMWVGTTTGTSPWAARPFEQTPARAEGYASPQVVIDGRFTYLAWANLNGDWITAADNRTAGNNVGGFAGRTFTTKGRDPRLVAAGNRVRVVWTTLNAPGNPARAFMAGRDGASNTAWTGRFVSPEAATDQTAAAIAVTSDLTTLILRSSLKLYTRTFD